MQALFGPAVALMSRLRYPIKFALIGLLFVLPLATVMYFFQKEINANTTFNQLEHQGVLYDRPLTRLLCDTLIHQQMVHSYYTDQSVSKEALLQFQQQIAT